MPPLGTDMKVRPPFSARGDAPASAAPAPAHTHVPAPTPAPTPDSVRIHVHAPHPGSVRPRISRYVPIPDDTPAPASHLASAHAGVRAGIRAVHHTGAGDDDGSRSFSSLHGHARIPGVRTHPPAGSTSESGVRRRKCKVNLTSQYANDCIRSPDGGFGRRNRCDSSESRKQRRRRVPRRVRHAISACNSTRSTSRDF